MQRTPSTPTKIAGTPTKTASTPAKTASAPNIDLRGFVARQFFVANLRTFLAYNLQAKKAVAYKKWQISGMPLVKQSWNLYEFYIIEAIIFVEIRPLFPTKSSGWKVVSANIFALRMSGELLSDLDKHL